VNKATLLEKNAHLVKSGVIPGISDIRDESDRKGMRVVIELKKDVDGRVVLNRLYKHTTMQTTFGANMVALVDMQPQQLPLRRLLECFLGHRHEVVTRRTQYELAEAEKRAHILEGLRIALDHIDAIIETIRSSPDVPTARAGLMEKFELTEVQANAILEMRLARLTGLERDKLEEEYGGLIKEIERLTGILENKALLKAVIGEEIADIRDRFADPRRTEITIAGADLVDEDLIAEEEMVVTITHLGYVKRLPLHTYRAQRRGGRGIQGTSSRDEDWADDIFVASTHDYMMFFTDRGRCYWLKVYEIPQAGRTARGKAIINCIQIGSDERVTAYTKVKTFDEDRFLVLATMKGQIKKTVLSAFGNPRRAGIRAINLAEGDTLIGADVTDGSNDVILATRTGRAVRFHERALRAMGRTAGGVRGISLAGEGDQVVGMVVVVPDRTVLTVTEKGYGKRTPVEDYRLTNRGGKGVINMRITEKNGPVVTIKAVANDDELMIITSGGIVIRTELRDISTMGRATQGVRVIKVNDDALVTDVARISQDSLTEGTDNGGEESNGMSELPADGPPDGGGEITDEMKADAQKLAEGLVDESGDEPADGSTDGND
jgi:DNA gyrase subunit A